MITFKQFLYEAEHKQDLIKFLRDNCDQAVHDMFKANHYLWRGMKKKTDRTFSWVEDEFDGFYGFPRDDRAPRDTPLWGHNAINDFFKKEFGEPLRSSSVFCYSRRLNTGGYGSIFAIIPIGPYKIYWSPKVEDLTTTLFPDLDSDEPDDDVVAGSVMYWIQVKKMKLADVTREMQLDYINKQLESSDYQEGPAVDALKHGGELMVKCKSYLALSISESELTLLIQDAAVDEKVEQ